MNVCESKTLWRQCGQKIAHVEKRNEYTVKETVNGQMLDDVKNSKWKGRLTNTEIDNLQAYYGMPYVFKIENNLKANN